MTDRYSPNREIDAIGYALGEALRQLESPTDGLGRPLPPMAASELAAARSALRLVVYHLGSAQYGVSQTEQMRISKRSGL
jgi:hypothetical protein